MQVAVESTTGLERRMTVELPEEGVSQEVGERLRRLMQTVRLPGFRPGKAPMNVVARRFGPAVRDEVVGELVRSSFADAVTGERLRPAGEPRIDSLESESGRGLRYTAVFEVLPEIRLDGLESVEIRRPAAGVEEADVDRMVETLRRRAREWREAPRGAREGDRVTLDFEGKLDGEPFEGGTAEDRVVEIGAGHLVPDFENGVLGMESGAEREVEVRFPGDYPAERLAGRTAVFGVAVRKVEEGVLPEVDAEFVRKLGVASGEVEDFRRDVRANLERELEAAVSAVTRNRLLDALLERHPLEVPEALVARELHVQRARQAAALEMHGLDAARAAEAAGGGDEALARRRVQLGLLLSEVIAEHDAEPDPDAVRAEIERMAATYEDPAQVVGWFYADPARVRRIETQLAESRALAAVLERVRVVDEPATFDDLMNPGQTSEASS